MNNENIDEEKIKYLFMKRKKEENFYLNHLTHYKFYIHTVHHINCI